MFDWFARVMIAPSATTLQMSSEDISEYEAIKKTWPKKNNQDKAVAKTNGTEEHRKEIRDRLGLKK